MHGDHVGVIERGLDARLTPEALAEAVVARQLRRDHLERDACGRARAGSPRRPRPSRPGPGVPRSGSSRSGIPFRAFVPSGRPRKGFVGQRVIELIGDPGAMLAQAAEWRAVATRVADDGARAGAVRAALRPGARPRQGLRRAGGAQRRLRRTQNRRANRVSAAQAGTRASRPTLADDARPGDLVAYDWGFGVTRSTPPARRSPRPVTTRHRRCSTPPSPWAASTTASGWTGERSACGPAPGPAR